MFTGHANRCGRISGHLHPCNAPGSPVLRSPAGGLPLQERPEVARAGWRFAIGDAVAGTGELAADGKLAAAARTFAKFPFNDDDIAAADDAGGSAVLVLHGSDTKAYATAASQHVTNHVPTRGWRCREGTDKQHGPNRGARARLST